MKAMRRAQNNRKNAKCKIYLENTAVYSNGPVRCTAFFYFYFFTSLQIWVQKAYPTHFLTTTASNKCYCCSLLYVIMDEGAASAASILTTCFTPVPVQRTAINWLRQLPVQPVLWWRTYYARPTITHHKQILRTPPIYPSILDCTTMRDGDSPTRAAERLDKCISGVLVLEFTCVIRTGINFRQIKYKCIPGTNIYTGYQL